MTRIKSRAVTIKVVRLWIDHRQRGGFQNHLINMSQPIRPGELLPRMTPAIELAVEHFGMLLKGSVSFERWPGWHQRPGATARRFGIGDIADHPGRATACGAQRCAGFAFRVVHLALGVAGSFNRRGCLRSLLRPSFPPTPNRRSPAQGRMRGQTRSWEFERREGLRP